MERKTESKTDNKRLSRVAEAYQRELSNLLILDTRDPRLNGVWITHVLFTPDLKLAKIYFNVSGGRVREDEVIDGFTHCKSFLRRELSQRVQMKYVPELKFYFDESAEVNQRLDELFKQIEDQKNGSANQSETSKED